MYTNVYTTIQAILLQFITRELSKITKDEALTQHNCIVLFVMAHGQQGSIFWIFMFIYCNYAALRDPPGYYIANTPRQKKHF